MATLIVGIISAAIAAASSIIVCIISHNKTVAIMEYKIDQLTEQVKKHNNLIDRMYQVERRVDVIEALMKEE